MREIESRWETSPEGGVVNYKIFEGDGFKYFKVFKWNRFGTLEYVHTYK